MRQKSTKQPAFLTPDYMESVSARPIRFLAEYLDTEARLAKSGIENTVVFFGSARTLSPRSAEEQLASLSHLQESDPRLIKAKHMVKAAKYYNDGELIAQALSEWSVRLKAESRKHFAIVTGGAGGMMEATNKGAYQGGADSLGFNISLPQEQSANEWIDPHNHYQFHYFFIRKFWLVYMAKAAIFLPGGFGTMDELFELLTLIQTKKIHRAFPIILHGKSFWNEVLDFEPLKQWGMISDSDTDLFTITDTVEEAMAILTHELTQWLGGR